MTGIPPLIEDRAQQFLLGLVHAITALPRYRFDHVTDRSFDAIAEIVRVERVELPTPICRNFGRTIGIAGPCSCRRPGTTAGRPYAPP